ncbi:hypothetical protein DRN74_02805 [Candidatus Micrarchaeota archaeon]|nr:MAG: hypothetical protein DRN74_02805 [Candidatus Micrarchaeota archaeon]
MVTKRRKIEMLVNGKKIRVNAKLIDERTVPKFKTAEERISYIVREVLKEGKMNARSRSLLKQLSEELKRNNVDAAFLRNLINSNGIKNNNSVSGKILGKIKSHLAQKEEHFFRDYLDFIGTGPAIRKSRTYTKNRHLLASNKGKTMYNSLKSPDAMRYLDTVQAGKKIKPVGTIMIGEVTGQRMEESVIREKVGKYLQKPIFDGREPAVFVFLGFRGKVDEKIKKLEREINEEIRQRYEKEGLPLQKLYIMDTLMLEKQIRDKLKVIEKHMENASKRGDKNLLAINRRRYAKGIRLLEELEKLRQLT